MNLFFFFYLLFEKFFDETAKDKRKQNHIFKFIDQIRLGLYQIRLKHKFWQQISHFVHCTLYNSIYFVTRSILKFKGFTGNLIFSY